VSGKEFLVAGQFSLADIAFVPALLILPRLGVDVDPSLRGVTAWINRLKQRPSIKALEA
jgi:glutathione S-transferase